MNTEITTKKNHILMVDDDRLVLATLANGLERAGYRVSKAESVTEAEVMLDNHELPDMVILDVHMPDREGLMLTDRLQQLGQIPFIMLTAHADENIVARASESGAVGYLVKPVDITQLIPAIQAGLSRAHDLRELRQGNQQLQEALDADRTISVAIGIIMDQHRLDQHDALELLRRAARNQQIKLASLASVIVSSRETLNLDIRQAAKTEPSSNKKQPL